MILEDFRDHGHNEFDAVGRPKLGSLATTRGILAASLIVTVCGWVVGCGNQPTVTPEATLDLPESSGTIQVHSNAQPGQTAAPAPPEPVVTVTVGPTIFPDPVPEEVFVPDPEPPPIDLCPSDPFKTEPGICGCGVSDADPDGDSWPDLCADNCPGVFNFLQCDSDHDGLGDFCDPPDLPEPNIVIVTELLLIADDGQFLGVVNDNPFDQDSIANQFGTYGSESGSLSIWNQFGTYGSDFSQLSPWNEFTNTPPLIFEDDGDFVMFVTANSAILPAIHPAELAIAVGRTDVLR